MVATLTQMVRIKGVMGAASSHPQSVQSESLDLDPPRSPRLVQPCGPTFSCWDDRFVMCETVHHPQTSETRVVILVRAGGPAAEQASWQWGQEVRREISLLIQG